jgi:hypothetical protein
LEEQSKYLKCGIKMWDPADYNEKEVRVDETRRDGRKRKERVSHGLSPAYY